MKHTPAEWKSSAVAHKSVGIIVYRDNGNPGEGYVRICRNVATLHDANLIAAAPDLYEALEGLLNWLASYPGGLAENTYEQARAALKKAVGQ